MRRTVLLFTITTLATVLITAGGTGIATADPLKNYRLLVPAKCEGSDEEFQFVINGEGIAGHIIGSTSNIMPVKDQATYSFQDYPELDRTVTDQLGKGNKKGLQHDLKTCMGSVEYEDPELGPVAVDFVIQAFFTPRSR